MRRSVWIYVAVILITLAASAASVFTRFNALYLLAATFTIAFPLWVGIPLVRGSSEEQRTRPTWSVRSSTSPNSRPEHWLFRFRCVIGWSAIAFSGFATIAIAYSVIHR